MTETQDSYPEETQRLNLELEYSIYGALHK